MILINNYEIIRDSDGICEGANSNGQFTHRYYAVGKQIGTAGNMAKFAVLEYSVNPDWDEPYVSHIEPCVSEDAAHEEFDYMTGANDGFYTCCYA